MKKILSFATALLLMGSFASCNKDDGYSPSNKRMLPSRIIVHEGNADPLNPQFTITTIVIEYNSQNQFLKVMSSSKFNGIENAIFTANFLYYKNDITVTTTRSDQPEYNDLKTFRRNKEQIILNEDNDSPINIDKYLRSKHFTYDSKGNIRKYDGDLSYDKENGIFRYVNMPSWYLTTQFQVSKLNLYNNCVSQMSSSQGGYQYACEYNADNYPVSISRVPIQIIGSGLLSHNIDYIEANNRKVD